MSLPPLQQDAKEVDELGPLNLSHITSAGDVIRADDEPFTWPGVQLRADARGVPKSISEVQGHKVETGQLCCQLWLTARNSATCST
jgi:hypothetical protein